MEYSLKNGKTLIIRKPVVEDAQAIINLISAADTETKFLARNLGEFCVTVEEEKELIDNVSAADDKEWFVAESDGIVVGNASVSLVSSLERYRHRAEVTFVVLKDYWGLGIGSKLMEHCIRWCKDKNVSQIELDVVSDNIRAISMYESFGFSVVGTIPNAMRYKDGSFADKKLMVLVL